MIRRPHAPLTSLVAGALAAATLAASPVHAAPPSSLSESRGYQACVKAAARDVQVIRMDEEYYINDHADGRDYYLNGSAFLDGNSEPVKVACETTRTGSRVLTVSVDGGSYAGRFATEPVEVANN